ncbi:MAG: hypothetical protein R3B94_15625 [Hyphomonas sp.]
MRAIYLDPEAAICKHRIGLEIDLPGLCEHTVKALQLDVFDLRVSGANRLLR